MTFKGDWVAYVEKHPGVVPHLSDMIRLKAQELANHILGKRTNLNFSEPKPVLHRTDSEAIRNRILSMTTADANKLGIRKNTLGYIQQHAKTEKSFRIYSKIRTKLSQSRT